MPPNYKAGERSLWLYVLREGLGECGNYHLVLPIIKRVIVVMNEFAMKTTIEYPAILAASFRNFCLEGLVISIMFIARSIVSEQKIICPNGINVRINKRNSIPISYLISSSILIDSWIICSPDNR